MGVAALVLGIIAIVLAFFGGAGGVLIGIAAIVLGVLGRRAAERDGLPQGAATAGMVTGIVGVVLGALIFAACLKCASGCAEVARGIARLGEARGTVEEIARLEIAYYQTEHLDADGNLLPSRFVSAGPTPATVPCQDKPVMVTDEEWRAAGWHQLNFALPPGPQRFQFEAMATGTGKTAGVDIVVRTDPRCDGTSAKVVERIKVDDEGQPYLVVPAHRRGYPGRSGGPGAPLDSEDDLLPEGTAGPRGLAPPEGRSADPVPTLPGSPPGAAAPPTQRPSDVAPTAKRPSAVAPPAGSSANAAPPAGSSAGAAPPAGSSAGAAPPGSSAGAAPPGSSAGAGRSKETGRTTPKSGTSASDQRARRSSGLPAPAKLGPHQDQLK